ncbi:hypothetical protein ACU686_33205 [Yinghuangia aomiensis]
MVVEHDRAAGRLDGFDLAVGGDGQVADDRVREVAFLHGSGVEGGHGALEVHGAFGIVGHFVQFVVNRELAHRSGGDEK